MDKLDNIFIFIWIHLKIGIQSKSDYFVHLIALPNRQNNRVDKKPDVKNNLIDKNDPIDKISR